MKKVNLIFIFTLVCLQNAVSFASTQCPVFWESETSYQAASNVLQDLYKHKKISYDVIDKFTRAYDILAVGNPYQGKRFLSYTEKEITNESIRIFERLAKKIPQLNEFLNQMKEKLRLATADIKGITPSVFLCLPYLQQERVIQDTRISERTITVNDSYFAIIKKAAISERNLWSDTILEGPYSLIDAAIEVLDPRVLLLNGQVIAVAARVSANAVYTDDESCVFDDDGNFKGGCEHGKISSSIVLNLNLISLTEHNPDFD